jgi:hypothetical protein
MKAKAKIGLDSYLFDTLMCDLVGHDRKPSAFLVYAAIAARNARGEFALSYAQLSDLTGLSRRATQDAVAHLVRRRLVESKRNRRTETTNYTALTPWRPKL